MMKGLKEWLGTHDLVRMVLVRVLPLGVAALLGALGAVGLVPPEVAEACRGALPFAL